MKPEEKAKELIGKFGMELSPDWDLQLSPDIHMAKECAIICVDEIISSEPRKYEYLGDDIDPLIYTKIELSNKKYWQEVKQYLNEKQ